MLQFKRLTVLGKNQMGKSELVKQALAGELGVGWDPNNEYKGGTRYVPTDMGSIIEYNRFCQYALTQIEKSQIKFFFVDETPLIMGNRYTDIPNYPFVRQMFFRGRHWNYHQIYIGITAGSMCNKILEESHEIICFHQSGARDIKRLEDIQKGFGELVKTLEEYQYVHYKKWDKTYEFKQMDPLDLKGSFSL